MTRCEQPLELLYFWAISASHGKKNKRQPLLHLMWLYARLTIQLIFNLQHYKGMVNTKYLCCKHKLQGFYVILSESNALHYNFRLS